MKVKLGDIVEIDRLTNRNALCNATVEDCRAEIDEMVRRWVK